MEYEMKKPNYKSFGFWVGVTILLGLGVIVAFVLFLSMLADLVEVIPASAVVDNQSQLVARDEMLPVTSGEFGGFNAAGQYQLQPNAGPEVLYAR